LLGGTQRKGRVHGVLLLMGRSIWGQYEWHEDSATLLIGEG
jgi:hypothetical protein